jgi:hypothetical protein
LWLWCGIPPHMRCSARSLRSGVCAICESVPRAVCQVRRCPPLHPRTRMLSCYWCQSNHCSCLWQAAGRTSARPNPEYAAGGPESARNTFRMLRDRRLRAYPQVPLFPARDGKPSLTPPRTADRTHDTGRCEHARRSPTDTRRWHKAPRFRQGQHASAHLDPGTAPSRDFRVLV